LQEGATGTKRTTLGIVDRGYEITISNIYALEDEDATLYTGTAENLTISNLESKSETDMKSKTFIDLLNAGQEEPMFVQDTKGINNGYPILKWQLEK